MISIISSFRTSASGLQRSASLLVHHAVLVVLLASLSCCSASEWRQEITIRAGILHAPPFATVVPNGDGTFKYGGLQFDLLQRLKTFAAKDDIKLDFELSPAPISYGDAFDLIANDCNSTEIGQQPEADCNRFDLIVADYYANGDRSFRADLTPSWLRSTLSTVKYTAKKEGSIDVTTMKQAIAFKQPVCIVDGTYYSRVLQSRFPDADWLFCPSQDLCLDILQQEGCALYADDELQLRFRAAQDTTLEVTPEAFNTQYLVWASRFDLTGGPYLRKWIYDSVANATMDELYFKYFQKELCPVGTAGENCELPCDPNTGEADDRGQCVCISTRWTGDDCSIEVLEDTNLVPGPLLAAAWVMLGINCVTILGFGVWLYWKRNTIQVRMSQPFFLCFILLGCLVSSSTIGAMTQGDGGSYEEEPACMAIPWLYSVGFCITFGTLFAKIQRVYLMFKSATAGNRRQNTVTIRETIVVTASVLLLDITVLLVWTFVDPLTWERNVLRTDKFGDPLESEGHCTSRHWEWWIGTIALLHLALLAVACYMCYVSRNISTKFSEGKYVSIAMFSNLQIFVVGVPILMILGSDPSSSFFVRTVVIWMNDFVVITLIFGNLIYRVHFRAEEDKTDIGIAFKGALSKFSSKVHHESRASKIDTTSKLHRSGISSRMYSASRYSSELPDVPEEEPEDLDSSSSRFAYESDEGKRDEPLTRPASYTSRFVQMSGCTDNSDITCSNRSNDGGEDTSRYSEQEDSTRTGPDTVIVDEVRPPGGLSTGQRSLIALAMQPQSLSKKRSVSGSASGSSSSSNSRSSPKPDFWRAVKPETAPGPPLTDESTPSPRSTNTESNLQVEDAITLLRDLGARSLSGKGHSSFSGLPPPPPPPHTEETAGNSSLSSLDDNDKFWLNRPTATTQESKHHSPPDGSPTRPQRSSSFIRMDGTIRNVYDT